MSTRPDRSQSFVPPSPTNRPPPDKLNTGSNDLYERYEMRKESRLRKEHVDALDRAPLAFEGDKLFDALTVIDSDDEDSVGCMKCNAPFYIRTSMRNFVDLVLSPPLVTGNASAEIVNEDASRYVDCVRLSSLCWTCSNCPHVFRKHFRMAISRKRDHLMFMTMTTQMTIYCLSILKKYLSIRLRIF